MERDRAALTRPNALPRWLVPAVALVPAVVLAGLYVVPMVTLLTRVVRPSSISDALQLPGLGGVLWFTLWQALVSTVLTMAIGFVPAYVLARYRFVGRRALRSLSKLTVKPSPPRVCVKRCCPNAAMTTRCWLAVGDLLDRRDQAAAVAR